MPSHKRPSPGRPGTRWLFSIASDVPGCDAVESAKGSRGAVRAAATSFVPIPAALHAGQLLGAERLPGNFGADRRGVVAARREDYLAWIDPSRPLWSQIDWLLLGIFAFMTLLITAGADLREDARIVAIGLAGGLVIESWGMQTGLWSHFTHKRPPLWILLACPVASLTIERLRLLRDRLLPHAPRAFSALHSLGFLGVFALLVHFTQSSRSQPLTPLVWLLCLLLALAPGDRRQAVLALAAGAGLGYLLELWGTTRLCWTNYTLQTPPLFAVLAQRRARGLRPCALSFTQR